MSRSPDLLLLHPGTNKAVYEKLADNVSAIEPPFMAGVAANFIRKQGHGVEVLDAEAEGLNYIETAEKIKEINPKLLTMIVHGQQPSASSHLMGAVGDICNEIKGVSDVPILLTGIHPSALPKRTLEEEACDFVARGEEFHTILGLVEGRDLQEVPGLAYLDEGNFRLNKAAPLIKNLDQELDGCAWDLLPNMSNYRAHNWHANFVEVEDRSPYASIYTSLGCPFKCNFCVINAGYKASIADSKGNFLNGSDEERMKILDTTRPMMRTWSPKKVVDTIEYLVKEQGVKHLKFIDEMYIFQPKHYVGIAEEIIERGLGDSLNIWAYARVDTVNEGNLDLLKQAGLNWVVLGIESESEHVRDGADKCYTNEDINHAVKSIQNAGINVLGNYIFGLPDDTLESMRGTLDLAKELNTEWYNGYAAVAYPGAPLYLWAKERGIALPGDSNVSGGWTAYSHHSHNSLPLPTDTLTAAEVLKFRDDAFHEYISNPKYLDLVKEKFGQVAVNHLVDLNKHRLKRRILGDPKD